MTTPIETIRDFYAKLAAGDVQGAVGLMAPDIEWTTMWHYKVDRLGLQKVAEGLLKPLMAEWSRFAMVAEEFVAEGETVVSFGRFKGVHGAAGKAVEAAYAHRWQVRDGRIHRPTGKPGNPSAMVPLAVST